MQIEKKVYGRAAEGRGLNNPRPPDIRETLRERKREAQSMRRTLAEWVSEGVPSRQLRREYKRIKAFEEQTEIMEELLIEDDHSINRVGFV